MANRIQIRRDSQSNWENINPVLADGELGLNYDNNQIKIGDGNNSWTGLSYATGAPSLATVATSGLYGDLSGKPTIPSTLQDLISYSAGNNKQFLRFNSGTSAIEFANDFRVVPYSSVVFPGGTSGVDKAGDVAFGKGGIYYCTADANSYSLTWVDPSGWASGIIQLSNRGPNNEVLALGSKLTDGNQVVTVTELITGGWDGTRQVVRLSTEISAWRTGTGTLTVIASGSTPNINPWVRLSTEIVSAPEHNNSTGVAGQIAYDTGYMYRCTQTNVTEVSRVYTTPRSTNTPGYPGGNQNGGDTTMNVMDAGGVPAPQNGWILSDGSSTRTITNVVRQNSAWGYIYTLSFTGSIDWTALDSITIISVQGVQAVWKRVALSADTW